MSTQQRYDVVVVGGGHNGLVSAAYLARAGLSVLVLERLARLGGAVAATRPFPGRSVEVPRYAATLGAMPDRLLAELDLGVELATLPEPAYDGPERAAWEQWLTDTTRLADAVAATLLEPLPLERTIREQVPPSAWSDLVDRPLGAAIEERFSDDATRGRAAVGGLGAGVVSLHDPSLLANRTHLQTLLARAWGRRAPVGGMGSLAEALTHSAGSAGADLRTSAGVSRIDATDDGAEVSWDGPDGHHRVGARWVLADVAPWVLEILLGHGEHPETKPVGADVRLDVLLEPDAPPAAGGRGPGYAELLAAYDDAAAGRLPDPIPGRLELLPTDPPVLRFHGVLVPAAGLGEDLEAARAVVMQRVLGRLADLGALSCAATEADSRPCVDILLPGDVEQELAMPGGHPWHGDPEWPWAGNRARLDTPAQRWGVQTEVDSVLVCGAGSRRGGGVSGLGGHAAARAVLESR